MLIVSGCTVNNDKWLNWGQWKELSFDLLQGLEVRGGEDASFKLSVSHLKRGDVTVAEMLNTPHLGERTQQSINKFSTNSVGVVTLKGGQALFELGGEQVVIRPGDIYIHDMQRPFRSVGIGDELIEWQVVHLPRNLLADQLEAAKDAYALRLEAGNPESRVFKSFLQAFHQNLDQLDEESLASFENTAIEMLNNVLFLRRPFDEVKNTRELNRVQTTLMAYLRQPVFNLQKIGEEVGISPRTIHRMFQKIGTTPAKWLEERRLEAIAKELRTSGKSGRLITNIAYSYGYNDPSHFSRVFKKRFGVSPRKYRDGD
jgi:AraC-like DNA-binding protein